MTTNKRTRYALAATLVLSLALTACGNGNGSNASESPTADPSQPASGEPVEISFLSLITTNLTEEFWDKWIADFESKNPDIKVRRIQAPSLEGLNDNYAKTLLTSGDFPDVLSNISYQDFAKAGALMDIPIDDDIKKINDYESLMLDGKLYTLQAYLQPHTQIFYNKDLFAQAGIDQLPRTWDELEEAAAKLQQAGITPFLTAGDWMTTLTFSILTGPEIFGKNPNWYADKNAGQVSYQDENWMTVAGKYKEFASKGYFNKGALSIGYEQVEQEFLKGNGAMYPMGSWFTAAYAAANPDFEAGVFAAPTLDGEKTYMSGSRGTSFAVSNTTAHPEAALRFAKYLSLDPDFHKAFAASDGMFSGLVEPVNYEFTPLQQEIADLLQEAGTMTGYETQRAGDFPVNGLGNQLAKVGQNLLLDGGDPAKELQSLDDYWEKNK
ncbi:ABC transporter substrate-binding protein [Paenibacillaceae bacterium WGS1546]|uniref:ABC transporter substrate-binding protein n=1 Tax=Cohnella sp. WGS1546 TaxID=3366810 RepID=UPI00372D854E